MILATIMVLQSLAHGQMMLNHYQNQLKISKIYAEIPEFARASLATILCGADRYNTEDGDAIIAKCDNCLSASSFILAHHDFNGQEQRKTVDEIEYHFVLSNHYPRKWLRPLTLAPPCRPIYLNFIKLVFHLGWEASA